MYVYKYGSGPTYIRKETKEGKIGKKEDTGHERGKETGVRGYKRGSWEIRGRVDT